MSGADSPRVQNEGRTPIECIGVAMKILSRGMEQGTSFSVEGHLLTRGNRHQSTSWDDYACARDCHERH